MSVYASCRNTKWARLTMLWIGFGVCLLTVLMGCAGTIQENPSSVQRSEKVEIPTALVAARQEVRKARDTSVPASAPSVEEIKKTWEHRIQAYVSRCEEFDLGPKKVLCVTADYGSGRPFLEGYVYVMIDKTWYLKKVLSGAPGYWTLRFVKKSSSMLAIYREDVLYPVVGKYSKPQIVEYMQF